MIPILLFWLSIVLILYAYCGYPLLLILISPFIRRKSHTSDTSINLKVTILISAYNEAANIENKIKNTIQADYPDSLKEIIVISDGSNDETNDIVLKYEKKGVILKDYTGRIGKTACLNKTVPETKGEILIFTDANSFFNRDAIKNLVNSFHDIKIGFVTGYTRYINKGEKREIEYASEKSSINLYTRLENFTKLWESKTGSCVGADGAIFAIRKCLYAPLMPEDINDFVIPLKIAQNNFYGVFEPHAFCFEKTTGSNKGEFERQIRITARTLRAIFKHSDLLNPLKHRLFSFKLGSHKLAKFLVPFWLALALTSNTIIVLNGNHFLYILMIIMQILMYFWAFNYKRLSKKTNSFVFVVGLYLHNFISANIAIGYGWLHFLRGNTFTTWNPQR